MVFPNLIFLAEDHERVVLFMNLNFTPSSPVVDPNASMHGTACGLSHKVKLNVFDFYASMMKNSFR